MEKEIDTCSLREGRADVFFSMRVTLLFDRDGSDSASV